MLHDQNGIRTGCLAVLTAEEVWSFDFELSCQDALFGMSHAGRDGSWCPQGGSACSLPCQ